MSAIFVPKNRQHLVRRARSERATAPRRWLALRLSPVIRERQPQHNRHLLSSVDDRFIAVVFVDEVIELIAVHIPQGQRLRFLSGFSAAAHEGEGLFG